MPVVVPVVVPVSGLAPLVVGPVSEPEVEVPTLACGVLSAGLVAALALFCASRARRLACVCDWVFTLPALLPAVALLRSPLEVMPPVLTDPPTLLVFNAVAALALALAWLLSVPAGVVT